MDTCTSIATMERGEPLWMVELKVLTINGVQEKGFWPPSLLPYSLFIILDLTGECYACNMCTCVHTAHACTYTHVHTHTYTHTQDTHTQTIYINSFAHIQEAVRLHNEHQMDLYLMEYMKNGGPPKKKGVRGDSDKPFDYHSEL